MPKFAEVDRAVTLERFLTGVNRRDSQAVENLIRDAGWELETSMRWISLFRRFADAGAGGDRWRDEPACRGVMVSCSRLWAGPGESTIHSPRCALGSSSSLTFGRDGCG